jgi:myo-inositol-1(or 4)-monophosphatase
MYLQQICSYVKDACLETGAFIREEQHKIKASNVEVKGLNDFVSYVDKTAEAMLVERLDKLIWDAGYIAEEGTRSEQVKEYTWIIDPLDGTTNYLHGLPPHAISIALQHEDKLVMGVVYEIVSGEMFYAWKEGGAYLNGNKIHVSNKTCLKESLIATGFPYNNFSKMDSYMKLFEELMQGTHGIRRLGSAAIDLAYVAAGRMDAFYEYGLKSWDVAAGSFIVTEAGGTVNDFSGGNNWLFGQEMVCGSNAVCLELTALTKKYFSGI